MGLFRRIFRSARPSQDKKRIVILGGGFGGVYTALELEKSLAKSPDIEVTLVNSEDRPHCQILRRILRRAV